MVSISLGAFLIMYRAGQLNQRIQFERDEKISDGFGGHVKEPYIYASAWAYVRKKSARELLQAQQIAATESVIFVVRKRADVLPSDRIVWRGVRFNIHNPECLDSRNAFLEIEAERGVAQ